jgi:hypothetical protein
MRREDLAVDDSLRRDAICECLLVSLYVGFSFCVVSRLSALGLA